MSRELTVYSNEMSLSDTMQLGQVLARSGFFSDAKQEAQAVVKVLAGRELGIGPIASMSGIYIIQGKPSIGYTLIASAIKKSGKYDYRVTEHSGKVCRIEFFQVYGKERESLGVSEFTSDDAKKQGTKNMDKFPKNMLFARAISNGAKWFCPDVFGGPVYTPDELGASVDYDTGEVLHVESESPPAPVVIDIAGNMTLVEARELTVKGKNGLVSIQTLNDTQLSWLVDKGNKEEKEAASIILAAKELEELSPEISFVDDWDLAHIKALIEHVK